MKGSLRLSICLAVCFVACALAVTSTPKVGSRRKIAAAQRLASSTSGATEIQSRSIDTLSKSHKTSRSTSSSSSSSRSVSTHSPALDYTGALIKTAHALARSHSTSEVLTLNLTNLLILVVLKAIIFGIGLFYFGGVSFKGGHGSSGGNGWEKSSHGRSLSGKSSSVMTQGELLLMMTYILGATNNDNYECMYRVACEDTSKAKDYLNASKMILKGAKFAKKFISYNPKYEEVVSGLQDAVAHKNKGGDCRKRYTCSDIPNL